MQFGKPLTLFELEYPTPSNIPLNLEKTPLAPQFRGTSHKIPFKEQYANESFPHIIKNVHYQYGTIKNRRAARYFVNSKSVRLVFSDDKDPFLSTLYPPKSSLVKFPPLTANTPTARSLRELGLKYAVQQYYNALDYVVFDEPQISLNANGFITPDFMIIPKSAFPNGIPPKSIPVDQIPTIKFEDAIFIELKAYNGITSVAEKEIMQAFNYAMYGGKALLITTGTLQLSDIFPYHGSYDDLLDILAIKYDNLAKEVDLSLGQDAFDSRGIYRSANEKLKKIQRHVNNWTPIDYELIKDPIALKDFSHSKFRLGVVDPSAFEAALTQQHLSSEASLFNQIRSAFLEEIIANPTILYP